MRRLRLALAILAAVTLQGCLRYEYEHEFWLRVDGSGTVYVTGRPELWTAFKAVGDPASPRTTVTEEVARRLFESSGLRVRRVRVTERGGRPYLFVSADFDDVNRLSGTPAFPDLVIGMQREGDRLQLQGKWAVPPHATLPGGLERDGLLAVRFHLPSKVYSHRNAVNGVERGNIVAWSSAVASALDGHHLDFGALIDSRSILLSTVGLFGGAIVLGLGILAFALWTAVRRGRRALESDGPATGAPPRP